MTHETSMSKIVKIFHRQTDRQTDRPTDIVTYRAAIAAKKTPHSDPGSLHKNRTPCETASVGYSVICLNCKSKNILTTYEGETGRLANVRTSEHIMDLNKNKKESPLVKHKILHHQGEKM